MRNCFAPAILQNSKLLAGAEGQLLKGFLHNHHKMPPCQHRQRDGHGWSTLGGQPSERWSWMVYAAGGSLQRDGHGWSTLGGQPSERWSWMVYAAGGSLQRDGHGWSILEGQPSERWSWMVYTAGAVLREMVMDGLHWGVGEGAAFLCLGKDRSRR